MSTNRTKNEPVNYGLDWKLINYFLFSKKMLFQIWSVRSHHLRVNFNNILQSTFTPISFCHKNTDPNFKQIKVVQNNFVQKVAHKMLLKLTHIYVLLCQLWRTGWKSLFIIIYCPYFCPPVFFFVGFINIINGFFRTLSFNLSQVRVATRVLGVRFQSNFIRWLKPT